MDSPEPRYLVISVIGPVTEHTAWTSGSKADLEIIGVESHRWWQKNLHICLTLFPLFVGFLAYSWPTTGFFWHSSRASRAQARATAKRDVDTFTVERTRLITWTKNLFEKNVDLICGAWTIARGNQRQLRDHSGLWLESPAKTPYLVGWLWLRLNGNIKELSNAIDTGNLIYCHG